MNKQNIKPFLKYVGGKTSILENILTEFPKEIENYHEIFVGGGSVLLGVLQKKDIKINGKIYAYDINEELIYTYINIQKDYLSVYNILNKLINTFTNCNIEKGNKKPENEEESISSKESYYYWIRKQYNNLTDKRTPLCSAYFIFLNKTCFRGLYRIGPNGFNVPYGNYKNPGIVDKNHLKTISQLIKDVHFQCLNFDISLKNAKNTDFIYLDPPYFPIKKTSFVDYSCKKFPESYHNKLFEILKNSSFNFVLSNIKCDKINEEFKEKYIKEIIVPRKINSKNPKEKVIEVIIKNFK